MASERNKYLGKYLMQEVTESMKSNVPQLLLMVRSPICLLSHVLDRVWTKPIRSGAETLTQSYSGA